MSALKRDLLKNLLLSIPDNGIVCAPFLLQSGLSYDNLKQYLRNGYIDSLGRGAYCKHGNRPSVFSALSAINMQLGLKVHLGSRSALATRGFVHFVPMHELTVTLFGDLATRLPAWMEQRFGDGYTYRRTGLFAEAIGVSAHSVEGFDVLVSCAERAILEYISGIPKHHSLNEAYQILELMNTLRPKVLQELLAKCSSVQTKRLFMLLAEDIHHSWYEGIDVGGVDFGSGCRVVEAGGKFNRKWQIVVKDWREV